MLYLSIGWCLALVGLHGFGLGTFLVSPVHVGIYVAGVWAFAAAISKWQRAPKLVITIVAYWVSAAAAVVNAEHFRALGVPMHVTLHPFADRQLLVASLLDNSATRRALAAVSLVFLLTLWAELRKPAPKKAAWLLSPQMLVWQGCALTLFIGVEWQSGNGTAHPLVFNLRRWALDFHGSDVSKQPKPGETYARPDLDGQKLAGTTSRPNVVLVLVEGLSGQMFGGHSNLTPKLAALSGEGFFIQNVLAPNRRTDNGVFSTLCGRYPYLTKQSSKFLELIANADGASCLPNQLRQLGYRTLYYQGSLKTYMRKNEVLPKIGFDLVKGAEDFNPAWKGWGIGDEEFFAKVQKELSEQIQPNVPFFATLLTVGTHHPYQLSKHVPTNDLKLDRALAYGELDDTLTKFLESLRSDTRFENTLFFVTGDESSDIAPTELSQNWLALLMLHKRQAPARQTLLFSQTDFPATLMDAMGIDQKHIPFGGRSMLRQYSASRALFFGNVNFGHFGLMQEPHRATICVSSWSPCRNVASPSTVLMGALSSQLTQELLTSDASASVRAGIRAAEDDAAGTTPVVANPEVTTAEAAAPGAAMQVNAGNARTSSWFVEAFRDHNLSDYVKGFTSENVTIAPTRERLQEDLPADNFSLRYSGCFFSPSDSVLNIKLGADDGYRLRIDGVVWIDDWTIHGYSTRTVSVPLVEGPHLLEVEYFDGGGIARLSLSVAIDAGKFGDFPADSVQFPVVSPSGRSCAAKKLPLGREILQ